MSRTSTPTSRSPTAGSSRARPEPTSDASRILGIDPGSLVTGWGLVGGTPAHPRWIEAGVIRLGRPSLPLAARLERLLGALESLLGRLAPTAAAVETPYHGVNARAALQLAEARGVILAALARTGVGVAEYAPATVKKAVTGNGRATKHQVRTMVSCLLKRHTTEGTSDLYDALAVALCHASSARHASLGVHALGEAGSLAPRSGR